MANEEQLRRLKEQGVQAWNEWRKANPNVEIDLSIELYFDFFDGTSDDTLSIQGARITEISDFKNLPTNLYV